MRPRSAAVLVVWGHIAIDRFVDEGAQGARFAATPCSTTCRVVEKSRWSSRLPWLIERSAQWGASARGHPLREGVSSKGSDRRAAQRSRPERLWSSPRHAESPPFKDGDQIAAEERRRVRRSCSRSARSRPDQKGTEHSSGPRHDPPGSRCPTRSMISAGIAGVNAPQATKNGEPDARERRGASPPTRVRRSKDPHAHRGSHARAGRARRQDAQGSTRGGKVDDTVSSSARRPTSRPR